MIKKTRLSPSLFCSLADRLNQKHPLYILADKICWSRFEDAFTPLYSADNGRPVKPIRLMCDLLILKRVRNLSDESVVEQWNENAYHNCVEVSGAVGGACIWVVFFEGWGYAKRAVAAFLQCRSFCRGSWFTWLFSRRNSLWDGFRL